MSSVIKPKQKDEAEALRKAAEDVVRKLYRLRAWNAKMSAIRSIDVKLLGETVELLSELIVMPETMCHASAYKVLSSLHKACSDRFNFLHGKMAADEEERRSHIACRKHVDKMMCGHVERFRAVGSTGKPTWLMKTHPMDGDGPERFLLLSSDMFAITQMETELANTLELGKLYKAEVPSAFIVRYLMAAVINDGECEKMVLLQIPEWVLRTAAERATKYMEDKQ